MGEMGWGAAGLGLYNSIFYYVNHVLFLSVYKIEIATISYMAISQRVLTSHLCRSLSARDSRLLCRL